MEAVKEVITYLEPDYNAVEESQLDCWRVFNGQDWVHGFNNKERAIEFAQRMGGTRIAFCKKLNGRVVYVSPERVEPFGGAIAVG